MNASTVIAPGAAADLLGEVRADPAAPIAAAICAPGGYGKTTVLAELARVYRAAGVPIATGWQAAAGPGDPVLLVDDAHRLDDERLGELLTQAAQPDARVIVAYRPWPRPAGLTRLAEVLRRGRPPVMLPTLTTDEIQAVVGSPALAGFVAALSGGVPRYVARLLPTLTGAEPPARVPAAALAPFAPELDELGADLRTLLLAVEAGAGLSFDLITALLDRDPETIAELVAAGQAAGLLAPDGALVPLARHAVAALGPIAQRVGVRQRLAELQLARGGTVLRLVRPLLPDDTGPAPAGLGPAFEAAGEEALGDDPALAARLFAAAADAGRPAVVRRALATALTGDLDLAARLADRTVASGPPAQRADAAYVAAVAMAHRGQLDRAAELLRWAGSGPGDGFRAVAQVGLGRPAEPGEPDAAGDGPPTLLHATATLLARGVRESVTGEPDAALSTVVQAAALLEPAGSGVLLPDSPAALAALIAVHAADLDVADATLDRAVRAGIGGPLLAPRHLLLQAWSRMSRGQLAAAGQSVTAAFRAGAPVPGGRDLLFAAALRVGLARRDSDLVGLRAVWPDACQVLIGQPVDLFMLLPLGELAVAAARLGEQRRVATHLAEADRLLERLGDPALWSAPLRWSRLHAAILAEQPEEAERHAAALDGMRGRCPAALADAARAWLAVITDKIDATQVESAARGLAELGLAWDAARLAGQAAIRTTDRKAMSLLLDCARQLQGRPAGGEAGEQENRAGEGQLLSDREREVAALVLAGLTYKQVADRLFLSAKTVEHHVARIRHRLGCTDRGELLSRLRELMADGAVA